MKFLNTGMNKGVFIHPHGKPIPKVEERGISERTGGLLGEGSAS